MLQITIQIEEDVLSQKYQDRLVNELALPQLIDERETQEIILKYLPNLKYTLVNAYKEDLKVRNYNQLVLKGVSISK